MDGEETVFKTSVTDNEYRILMKLKESDCVFIPEVKGHNHGNVKGEKVCYNKISASIPPPPSICITITS